MFNQVIKSCTILDAGEGASLDGDGACAGTDTAPNSRKDRANVTVLSARTIWPPLYALIDSQMRRGLGAFCHRPPHQTPASSNPYQWRHLPHGVRQALSGGGASPVTNARERAPIRGYLCRKPGNRMFSTEVMIARYQITYFNAGVRAVDCAIHIIRRRSAISSRRSRRRPTSAASR